MNSFATAQTTKAAGRQAVVQFSVFTANRLGRLHDLVDLLGAHGVNVLAVTVLDTTDSAILRMIVDDTEKTRELLVKHGFPHSESDVLVVELADATQLRGLMSALLEAELNVNYLYCFIPHPNGRSVMALSMEDNEVAESMLSKHGFRVLRQADILR